MYLEEDQEKEEREEEEEEEEEEEKDDDDYGGYKGDIDFDVDDDDHLRCFTVVICPDVLSL